MNVLASVLRLLDVQSKQRPLFAIVYQPHGGGRALTGATLSHTTVVEPICCPHCGARRR